MSNGGNGRDFTARSRNTASVNNDDNGNDRDFMGEEVAQAPQKAHNLRNKAH